MCREGFPLVSQLVASTYALSLHVLKTLLGMVTLPTWCGKHGEGLGYNLLQCVMALGLYDHTLCRYR